MLSSQTLKAAWDDLDKKTEHPSKDFDTLHDLTMTIHPLWCCQICSAVELCIRKTLDMFLCSVQFDERTCWIRCRLPSVAGPAGSRTGQYITGYIPVL
jgi:hypothetical protein